MITIKNLTKKYKSKNHRTCVALNQVSLNLPDNGMVFIIGKSGSGKSTLLNLIGGLDGFDGGTIIADGNDISKFKASDFYKYRASYASFIFQDYHLIDELTIKENVKLALEIEGEQNIDISPSLMAVDLAGYEDRFPDELSGGQKQRVAIARAIVKSPRVILCDEPTGNLDKNTSTQILDLLKDISKERLVLIVSHNMPDAEKYGDRIIELADGKIINDKTRKAGYKNNLSLNNGVLTLPYNRNLTDEELRALNAEAKRSGIQAYAQNSSGYEPTKEVRANHKTIKLKRSKMKFNSIAKLFTTFTRRNTARSAVTAFISSIMLVLLIIFQSFLSFDGGKVISDSLAEQGTDTLVLKKNAYYDEYENMLSSSLYSVTDEDVEQIKETSGAGAKTYLLYSHCLYVKYADHTPGTTEQEKTSGYTLPTNNIYTTQMTGTLACDMDYLVNKFGEDGKLTVLAGDIDQSYTDGSVIITDYLADAMLVYNPEYFKNYNDLLGPHIFGGKWIWGNISAIIKTGYKEKYHNQIEKLTSSFGKETQDMSPLDEQESIRILDDIRNNLSIAYSLNPDFHNAVLPLEYKDYIRLSGYICYDKTGKEIYDFPSDEKCRTLYDVGLNDGEIMFSLGMMKNLFPEITDGNYEFPFKVKIKRYELPNEKGKLLYEREFTVVGISPNNEFTVMTENDLMEVKKADIIPYSVYITNYENADDLINEMSARYFSWSSTNGAAVTLLNQSINMFYDLFMIFKIMLVALIIVFLISHSVRSVKDNYYQIGVIKAIGGRSLDISYIYTLQTFILTIFICISTYICAFYLVGIANDVLIKSFTRIANTNIGSIDIICFEPRITLMTIISAFVLSILSTIAPLLALVRIKPINIIKAKE